MPEIFMLDTDICSYIIRDRPLQLKKDFLKRENDTICISVITYAELLYGFEKNPSEKLERDINDFVTLVQVKDWDHIAALKYAKIRHHMTSTGKIISALDMQIAAAAISLNAGLVTNNKKHFSLIPDLTLVDWL